MRVPAQKIHNHTPHKDESNPKKRDWNNNHTTKLNGRATHIFLRYTSIFGDTVTVAVNSRYNIASANAMT